MVLLKIVKCPCGGDEDEDVEEGKFKLDETEDRFFNFYFMNRLHERDYFKCPYFLAQTK